MSKTLQIIEITAKLIQINDQIMALLSEKIELEQKLYSIENPEKEEQV